MIDYDLVGNDRNRHGVGVCFYSRSELKYLVLSEIDCKIERFRQQKKTKRLKSPVEHMVFDYGGVVSTHRIRLRPATQRHHGNEGRQSEAPTQARHAADRCATETASAGY